MKKKSFIQKQQQFVKHKDNIQNIFWFTFYYYFILGGRQQLTLSEDFFLHSLFILVLFMIVSTSTFNNKDWKNTNGSLK